MLEVKAVHLKVLSAVCSNLVAFWFLAIFASTTILMLTMNIVAVILSWRLAIWAEGVLEQI